MDTYPSDCIQNVHGEYTLVKYPPDKKHDPAYSAFRSVVYKNDVLVAVSPSKSIPYERFRETYHIRECIVEEFVEGTMINVWWENEWKIATKSIIGAECTFESNRTFASMFYECLNNSEIDLNPTYCYSMVMQHPDNIIVTPVREMKLYIVGVYSIHSNKVVEILDRKHSPPTYSFRFYIEAEEFAQTVQGKGLMLKFDGQRAKIKRTKYYEMESVKQNSTFDYRYLCVRTTPEKEVFVETFPFYNMNQVENDILASANVLYQTYVHCYIKKLADPKESLLKKYLRDIHMYYLNFRKPLRITKQNVQDYVQRLLPNQITLLLRVVKTLPTIG